MLSASSVYTYWAYSVFMAVAVNNAVDEPAAPLFRIRCKQHVFENVIHFLQFAYRHIPDNGLFLYL